MIEVDTQDDQIVAIRVGGESLRSDDGEMWFLPKGVISAGILVNQLPEHASFEICERIEGDVIVIETIPIRITRVGSDRVRLDFEDSGTRKYWDGPVGFKPYMEAKKAVVEERATEIGDLVLDHYEDDGAWIHLAYSAEIESERLHAAVQMADQILGEIDGAADIESASSCGSPPTRRMKGISRSEWCSRLFGSLGFRTCGITTENESSAVLCSLRDSPSFRSLSIGPRKSSST